MGPGPTSINDPPRGLPSPVSAANWLILKFVMGVEAFTSCWLLKSSGCWKSKNTYLRGIRHRISVSRSIGMKDMGERKSTYEGRSQQEVQVARTPRLLESSLKEARVHDSREAEV